MGGGLKNRKSIVQGTNLAPTDSASIRIYADFIQKEDAGYNNALLYEIHLKAGSSEDEWKVSTSSYDVKNNALGEMGTYYRAAELSKLSKYSTIINNWGSDNIISSVKGAYECYTEHELLSGLDKNKQLIHNKRLSQLSSVPVKIEIILPSGVNLAYVKIPVLGELYDDGKISKWIKFDPKHKIGDKDHDWSDDIYYDLKTPPLEEGAVDLRLASHRGFWGYDLGNGPIENTEPSIKAAKKYTNIIESDISITKDSVIVVSHDYNLQRLTDYNVPNYKGKTPENTFIYDLTMPELKKFDLHLKKRNSAVDKNFQLITLEALLEYMEENKTALHLDVKERAQRRDPITGDCTAACDVNRNKRDTAWVALLRKIIEVTDSAEAWDHVTVKTTLPPSKIVSLLGRKNINKLRKIHFLPVIHPGANLDNAINFINEWYNNAPTLIAGFETSFKTLSEPVMNPFIKNGKTYQNIFHYIISETGLRPGLYSEEPMGPKGVVDRYAQWMFKDLSKDFRGDPFFLMDVPYYGTSIITTDRPDIWKAIGDIYKNPTLTHSMSSNNSSESDATNDATIIDHSAISKINARYESGTIIINGLDKIDIGSNIALFNPQGGLIYQSRITTEPQMVIPASIPFGVCILRISGNRSESFKLLINN
jgi:glycerophosphoryl diester phosphodiesterase